MPSPRTATDAYLAALPADQRAALTRLRAQLVAAAPGAVDHFGYGVPGLFLDGHPLIYFGAAKAHCALYGTMPAGFDDALRGFARSKGAVKFTPARPLPAALVKAIVKAKIAEHRARWGTPAKATPRKARAISGGVGVTARRSAR